MLEQGWPREAVAKALALDLHEVQQVQHSRSPGDPAVRRATDGRLAWRAATNPQFEEVLQLLIPDPATLPSSATVLLQLLDKRGAALGAAKVPLRGVLEAPDLKLSGAFVLEPLSAELVGSLSLRFLAR